ncbi:hypothetical protein HRR83_001648 [Exophiala dermatitidis]|uniref:Uncharacterized protein n=1 Tax=Exophiala dermatitidis TaxID=5970 RepID=A0AAN6F2U0_EXODE|nr:hypothetical protein HRR73_004782 [Exophiala dermatitidis]KAJ4523126.1 hypothetical protein HRR75_001525 [Exophiala dermatitidis]KAJ4526454.1 hypothetical protein HRR74_001652 [Exophiala dermatitidis]KAJ4532301.1 hypothetical protein HRR76_007298 [Exophiala dermatitidis]KAJ4546340.1 hypothetical protein HRR77_004873 [Exophiala dermatitidis]
MSRTKDTAPSDVVACIRRLLSEHEYVTADDLLATTYYISQLQLGTALSRDWTYDTPPPWCLDNFPVCRTITRIVAYLVPQPTEEDTLLDVVRALKEILFEIQEVADRGSRGTKRSYSGAFGGCSSENGAQVRIADPPQSHVLAQPEIEAAAAAAQRQPLKSCLRRSSPESEVRKSKTVTFHPFARVITPLLL